MIILIGGMAGISPSLSRQTAFNYLRETGFFYEENQAARGKLADMNIKHQWLTPTGGHTGSLWRSHLPKQLEYFMKFY